PRTGGYFKRGPQESFLLEHLDGRHGADEVRRAFSRRFNEPLGQDDLRQFLDLAEESGFIGAPTSAPSAGAAAAPRLESPAAPSPQPRAPAERENRQSILYWRKSVFDPDPLFDRLEPRLRFLWTRAFVVAS